MHWVVVEGAAEAVRFLVTLGANVNGGNRDGETTVISAASRGDTEMLEVLLSLGADPSSVSELRGRGLECACRSGNVQAVQMLLDAGADARGIEFRECLPEDILQREEMMRFLQGLRLLGD